MKRHSGSIMGVWARMFYHIEERRAWLRSRTHTIVFDRDPEYARFAADPSGTVKRMLRIWLAEQRGPRRHLHAYLGTVTFCATGPSFRDLRRLLHLASRAARAAGQSARTARRHLCDTLRRYAHQCGDHHRQSTT